MPRADKDTESEVRPDPTCFVIMPISTPEPFVARYGGDPSHFRNVLEHLFTPALEEAGYRVEPPEASGAELIHARIILKLNDADLVFCDMSTLNANVFFELGIRTALNKPVCVVADDKTATIPFDLGVVNRHTYRSSLHAGVVKDEIPKLVDHVRATEGTSENSMWRTFGVEAQISTSGVLDRSSATAEDKLDLLLRRMDAIEQLNQREGEHGFNNSAPMTNRYFVDEALFEVETVHLADGKVRFLVHDKTADHAVELVMKPPITMDAVQRFLDKNVPQISSRGRDHMTVLTVDRHRALGNDKPTL